MHSYTYTDIYITDSHHDRLYNPEKEEEEEESFVISVIHNDKNMTESKRRVDIDECDSDIGGKGEYNDSFI
jgi:hypothetical protein